MTAEQRVGQLIFMGIGGDHLTASETQAIRTHSIGSIWLYYTRTGGAAPIATLASEIGALATPATTGGVRFFIGVDQEGGTIQRLKGPGFSTIPSALEQGALPVAVLETDAFLWGGELNAAGVNVNFAPVMDVVPPGTDASNAPIGALRRAFGHDPETVGTHGAAVVRGMDQAGIAPALKHFPGLGRVTENTDYSSAAVDTVMTADDPYLEPFRMGIEAGAPLVMISLADYPKIDPDNMAVFSSIVIEDVLRDRLGFEGVVVSDDIGAATAVKSIPVGTRAVRFVEAGGDLIAVAGDSNASKMAAALLARAESDPAFKVRVDQSALRVLQAKERYGLLACI
jgi:beta-N-acetylhexosaminidase